MTKNVKKSNASCNLLCWRWLVVVVLAPLLLVAVTSSLAFAASRSTVSDECRADVYDLAQRDVAVVGALDRLLALQRQEPNSFAQDANYQVLEQSELPNTAQARNDSIDRYNLDASVDGCPGIMINYPDTSNYQTNTELLRSYPAYIGKNALPDLSQEKAIREYIHTLTQEDHLLMEVWFWSK
jgi:hypothetical protein